MVELEPLPARKPTKEPVFVLPRLPETNTISTAAYAAVAAKTLSLVAAVETLMPVANKMIKVSTSARRISGFRK